MMSEALPSTSTSTSTSSSSSPAVEGLCDQAQDIRDPGREALAPVAERVALTQNKHFYLGLASLHYPAGRRRPVYTFYVPPEIQERYGVAPRAVNGITSLTAAARFLAAHAHLRPRCDCRSNSDFQPMTNTGHGNRSTATPYKTLSGERLRMYVGRGRWQPLHDLYVKQPLPPLSKSQPERATKPPRRGRRNGPLRRVTKKEEKFAPRKFARVPTRALPLSRLLHRRCKICHDEINVVRDDIPRPARSSFKYYHAKYGVDLRTCSGTPRRVDVLKHTGWVCPHFPESHVLCDADFATWVSSCIQDDRYPITCPFPNCSYEIRLYTIQTVLSRIPAADIVPLEPSVLQKQVVRRHEKHHFDQIVKRRPYMYYTRCDRCGEWLEWNRQTCGGVPRVIMCECGYDFCTGCGGQHCGDNDKNHYTDPTCARPHHVGYIAHATMMDAIAAKLLTKEALRDDEESLFAAAIEKAYENGQSVPCPKCHYRMGKDDDTCTQINKCNQCGAMWCYACGRLAARTAMERDRIDAEMGREAVLPQCYTEREHNHSHRHGENTRDGEARPPHRGYFGSMALFHHNEITDSELDQWNPATSRFGVHCPQMLASVGMSLDDFHAQRTFFEMGKVIEHCSYDSVVALLERHGKTHVAQFVKSHAATFRSLLDKSTWESASYATTSLEDRTTLM